MSFQVRQAGGAALAALRGGPARIFARFEHSCYVETSSGIACLGGPGLGLGPLNAIVDNFKAPAIGESVAIDLNSCLRWTPSAPSAFKSIPKSEIPESIEKPAKLFLAWLQNEGSAPDELIGLGPGLTPAGDDFAGGAMIALRVCGTTACHAALADRIAAWALPLARERTNRISRAHLECAAAGEGHEFLHGLLASLGDQELYSGFLKQLARVGHTSGLDAAAGALLSLKRLPLHASV